MTKTQNNPTVGATGGQLHSTFPVAGRFGTETVTERRRRQEQRQQEQGVSVEAKAPSDAAETVEQQRC
jgi:hypothetical protein